MVLADLRAEGDELESWVVHLPETGWRTPTPAVGWTVAHQVAHLAWTDERALLSATDPDGFHAEAAALADGDPQQFVDDGAAAGAGLPVAELLSRWRSSRERLATVLAEVPVGAKLPWYGPPMSATSMATARIMETWAHAGDVADTLEIQRKPTARIRHVAHIGVRTRDFAYLVRGLAVPVEQFRIELTAPDGELWVWGPDDAAQRITGSAHDFCRLVTQRVHRDDTDLVPHQATSAL